MNKKIKKLTKNNNYNFFLTIRIYLLIPILLNCFASYYYVLNEIKLLSCFLISFSIYLIAAYGFIDNDMIDRNIDNINGVFRLQFISDSNLFKLNIIKFIFLFIAFFIGLLIDIKIFIAFIFISILLFFYNRHIVKKHLYSNLLAAFLSLSPLWIPLCFFSGYKNIHIKIYYILLIGLLLYLCGREIILDSLDTKGDIIGKRKTLPIIFGLSKSILIAKIFHYLSLILTTISFSFLFFFSYYQTYKMFAFIILLFLFNFITFIILNKIKLQDMNSFNNYITKSRFVMSLCSVIILLLGWK
ncbi:MAG TPA: UbiA family prenyltransferase [bacterium]|nr:UbiA family prenyltransferase [bacterium]